MTGGRSGTAAQRGVKKRVRQIADVLEAIHSLLIQENSSREPVGEGGSGAQRSDVHISWAPYAVAVLQREKKVELRTAPVCAVGVGGGSGEVDGSTTETLSQQKRFDPEALVSVIRELWSDHQARMDRLGRVRGGTSRKDGVFQVMRMLIALVRVLGLIISRCIGTPALTPALRAGITDLLTAMTASFPHTAEGTLTHADPAALFHLNLEISSVVTFISSSSGT